MRAVLSPFTVALLAVALAGCSAPDRGVAPTTAAHLVGARLVRGRTAEDRDHRGTAVHCVPGAGT